MTQGQPGGWQPPVPPDGPTSPTTPVRPLTGNEAPPPSTGAFDAIGMQSALTRSRDQSRFVAPVIEDEATKRPLPFKALLWGAVSLLTLGVTIGVVYVNYFRPVVIDPDTIVRPTSAPSNEPPPVTSQTPEEIVQEYFTALSTGQVRRALAMGPTGGTGSRALLTSRVFNEAREGLPITDVEVLTEGATPTEVPVRYHLDGQPHETTMLLTLTDAGEYQLARTTVTAEFSVPGGQRIPLRVNGQAIDSDQPYEVLPGRYEVTTGLPFIDYSDSSDLEVPGLGRDVPYSVNVVPELTTVGEEALIDAARTSLNACIAQRSMAPDGCPNRAGSRAGQGVVDSSAQWRLTNNPWAEASPTLTAADQGVALVRVPMTTQLSFDYADGGRSEGRPVTSRVEARADLLGTDPDAIEVNWSVG